MSRPIDEVLDRIRAQMMPTGAGVVGPGAGAPPPPQAAPPATVIGNAGANTPEIGQPQQSPQSIPRDADSRLDLWRGLLSDFVWSLGSGMSERAKSPRGGVGAALLGPFTLRQEQEKQENAFQLEKLRLAQEDRTRVASMEAMNKISQSQTELPARIQQILSQAGVNQARIPQIQAQTATEQQRPGLVQAQAAEANRDAGAPYPQQRVDPLSPEGVQAQVGLQSQLSAIPPRQGYQAVEIKDPDRPGKYLLANYRQGVVTHPGTGAKIDNPEPYIPISGLTGEAGVFTTLTDDQGRVVGGVNFKTGRVVTMGDLGVNPDLFRGPVSPARAEMQANARSGLRAVSKLRDEIAKPGILAELSIPGSPTARTARAARGEMIDVLIRLRTGAALNDEEQRFYRDQAPGLIDALFSDPETIAYKLSIFEDQFSELAGSKAATPVRTGAGAGTATRGAAAPAAGPAPAGPVPDFIMRNGRLVPNPAKITP